MALRVAEEIAIALHRCAIVERKKKLAGFANSQERGYTRDTMAEEQSNRLLAGAAFFEDRLGDPIGGVVEFLIGERTIGHFDREIARVLPRNLFKTANDGFSTLAHFNFIAPWL